MSRIVWDNWSGFGAELPTVTVVLSFSLHEFPMVETPSTTLTLSPTVQDRHNLVLPLESLWLSTHLAELLVNPNVSVQSTWVSGASLDDASLQLVSEWGWTTVLLEASIYPAVPQAHSVGGPTLPPGVPSEVTLKTP